MNIINAICLNCQLHHSVRDGQLIECGHHELERHVIPTWPSLNEDLIRTEEDHMPRNHESKTTGGKTEAKKPSASQLQQEIEQLAYTLFCQCGYDHGHDVEHWAEAERRVQERYQGARNKEE